MSRTVYSAKCFALPSVLLTLVCAPTALAANEVVRANVYIADAVGVPPNVSISDVLKAGKVLTANFLLTDQATNATIGTSFGYTVGLRDGGPSQGLYTLQLASGSVQVAGIVYAPGSKGYQNITDGLLAITGGTGIYTGATGYYLITEAPATSHTAYVPGQPVNGIVVSIDY